MRFGVKDARNGPGYDLEGSGSTAKLEQSSFFAEEWSHTFDNSYIRNWKMFIENDRANTSVERMAIQEIRIPSSAWNEKRPALSGRPTI